MSKQLFSRLGILGFFVFFLSELAGTGWCDLFISYPGTRAKAMGGAFVGVADDSSACWYNPAGLATLGIDWTGEYSQALSVDDNGEYDNSNTSLFFGFKGGIEYGKKGGVNEGNSGGLGLFYYKPYNVQTVLSGVPSSNGYIAGRLDEGIHIVGLVGAGDVGHGLKLGCSLEVVNVGLEDSDLYEYKKGGSLRRKVDVKNMTGLSASLGLLWDAVRVEEKNWGLRLGAAYRLPSAITTEQNNNLEKDMEDRVIFKKPASYDFGVSLTKPLWRVIVTLSGQWGQTDYGTASDYWDFKYSRAAGGAEVMVVVFKDYTLYLRGGGSKAEPDDDEFWPDIATVSAGFGFDIGKNTNIEAAWERRAINWTNDYKEDQDIDLFSASLNISF